jgi:ABC-type glycerol-3-phosphate transport system substrate-binding protein
MQQLPSPKFVRSKIAGGIGWATVVGLFLTAILFPILLVGCGGCNGDSQNKTSTDQKPAGPTLTMSCPDRRLADILAPMAKVWAARVGGKVEFTATPMAATDQVDVGVMPFAELGEWADRGDLLPIPAALKEPGHPYQWSGVFAVYRGEPYAGWGSQLLSLPLAGDGFALVYRADLLADNPAKIEFQKQTRRSLLVPETWDDLADVAAFFSARDKRPSMPLLPTDPARLVNLFSRVAASYDRSALGETAPGGKDKDEGPIGESLAFQFHLRDGRPRIDSQSFRTAAGWLADLRQRNCVPADGPADPVAALTEGRAILAILSLDEIARLQGVNGRVDTRFGIAPVPGARATVDPKTGSSVLSSGNYIPYFAGGWIGVVRKRCPRPDAAFDLLAELGGPARSQELLAAAAGYGPFRDSHLDPARSIIWYGYGFDADQSKRLQQAMQNYVGKTIRNPTYGLRGPDHTALTNALADELKRVVAGAVLPNEAMKRVVTAWDKSTAGIPADKLTEWRRKAVGLY